MPHRNLQYVNGIVEFELQENKRKILNSYFEVEHFLGKMKPNVSENRIQFFNNEILRDVLLDIVHFIQRHGKIHQLSIKTKNLLAEELDFDLKMEEEAIVIEQNKSKKSVMAYMDEFDEHKRKIMFPYSNYPIYDDEMEFPWFEPLIAYQQKEDVS